MLSYFGLSQLPEKRFVLLVLVAVWLKGQLVVDRYSIGDGPEITVPFAVAVGGGASLGDSGGMNRGRVRPNGRSVRGGRRPRLPCCHPERSEGPPESPRRFRDLRDGPSARG